MQGKQIVRFIAFVAVAAVLYAIPQARAQFSGAANSASASSIPASALIQPDALNGLLKPDAKEKPLVLQVGSHVMFDQAHMPGRGQRPRESSRLRAWLRRCRRTSRSCCIAAAAPGTAAPM